MVWEYFRWTPAAFAVVFYLIGVVSDGGPEPLFLIALLVIQLIVIVLPKASKWAGRKVGEKRSESTE